MHTINEDLVRKFINKQLPEWSKLEIRPVKNSGNDNRTFHLGNHMSVRLPSAECYVSQVEKEQNGYQNYQKNFLYLFQHL